MGGSFCMQLGGFRCHCCCCCSQLATGGTLWLIRPRAEQRAMSARLNVLSRNEARLLFLAHSLNCCYLNFECVWECVWCVCVQVHSKCVSLFANCNHCCCCAANETKVKATSFARVQLSHKIPCKVVKEISIKPSLMTSCMCSAVALHFTGCK